MTQHTAGEGASDRELRREWIETFAIQSERTFRLNADGTYANQFVDADWREFLKARRAAASLSAGDANPKEQP